MNEAISRSCRRKEAEKRPRYPGRYKTHTFLSLALSMASATCAFATVEAEVDFSKSLRVWDGFGVNYVETAQTRDYFRTPEDYGGFGLMTEARRSDVLNKIFGEDGLKPGIVKMFLDPFHEGYTKADNDNGDPHVIDLAGYDHTTTTEWMRYFAREGLARTRARGGDLQFITTLYGPAPWMTRQKFVRGRDLDPAEKYECAEYMISWAKFLRDIEGLPVNYISIHNEGEVHGRWPKDGLSAGSVDKDHNLYWPPAQVVDFLQFMRPMLDAQGMHGVALTPGETTAWDRLYALGYASSIAADPTSLRHLGLITSHGFLHSKRKFAPGMAIRLLRDERPELHAWTTSTSWGRMDARFVDDLRVDIYQERVNAIIPWAIIQRAGAWIGGDPNPGTAFHVNEEGRVIVRPGYYFYKQVSRAGQPGMAVAAVSSSNEDVTLAAFARGGTKHPDAFVIINLGKEPRSVSVRITGAVSDAFHAFRTSEDGKDQYSGIGRLASKDGRLTYEAPAGSVTTFFGAAAPVGSRPVPDQLVFSDDFSEASRGDRARNIVGDPPPDGLAYKTDTPYGFSPRQWIVADEEAGKARRGFWCIPEKADGTAEAFMRQAGRSRNSIAYAAMPVPSDAASYVVEFKQWCNDNDYIGFILGASQPVLAHDGAEFGYERQLPKTDKTVDDIYYRGALGAGKIEGQAKMRRWAAHRIEVEGGTIRWFQDGTKLLEGRVVGLKPGGYFGIRQRYERGTRYDDVRITLKTR